MQITPVFTSKSFTPYYYNQYKNDKDNSQYNYPQCNSRNFPITYPKAGYIHFGGRSQEVTEISSKCAEEYVEFHKLKKNFEDLTNRKKTY